MRDRRLLASARWAEVLLEARDGTGNHVYRDSDRRTAADAVSHLERYIAEVKGLGTTELQLAPLFDRVALSTLAVFDHFPRLVVHCGEGLDVGT